MQENAYRMKEWESADKEEGNSSISRRERNEDMKSTYAPSLLNLLTKEIKDLRSEGLILLAFSHSFFQARSKISACKTGSVPGGLNSLQLDKMSENAEKRSR